MVRFFCTTPPWCVRCDRMLEALCSPSDEARVEEEGGQLVGASYASPGSAGGKISRLSPTPHQQYCTWHLCKYLSWENFGLAGQSLANDRCDNHVKGL